MCGIVGYIGKNNATPFLIDGLRALEYRGYDSAGIYVVSAGTIKRAGKVEELAKSVPEGFSGTAGIAHTRWATHGLPTELNAHPHADESETVWLVHNGIIENYAELRDALSAKGVRFRTETDTEALVALIASKYDAKTPLEEAVRAALAEVRGTYGIVVASVREPEKLVAARFGSPLMLGIGTDGYYIASDATPILKHTREVVYLDDGEMVIVTREGYDVRTREHEPVKKTVETLEWDVEAVQKKGHEHFMLKEIMEVPEVIENSMRGRLVPDEGTANLGGLRDVLPRVKRAKRIIITGCGSAYYAGLVGELLIEELAGIPVEVEIASELRYRRPTMNPEDAVLIAISQSGETLDTLEAIKEAKRHGMLTLGIVNVVGSTIARETDAGVYNHAGPEIGVASTKAFVSQLTVLSLIGLLLGRADSLSATDGSAFVRELAALPEHARTVLSRAAHIEALAKRYASMEDALFLGRKFQSPIAYEGALKLKEISYVHAEGYPAGEMKHGPIALIEPAFPSVVLAPRDSLYEKTKSNIQEIRARSGKVIAVTTDGSEEELAQVADDVIAVPKTHEALLPILTTIPLQLFAYYVAKERGLPIDKPRNLAKSVTVE
ncbi:MAG: glutamine--fructose-6-phosphate transaminase (isomerizing) [Patescibacteria group bacterium]|nr:glutamine--fructose-6-phosphate transaminase (isomerizing) [Patescibacteria group bacterium]MDE1965686.1 glutamine--fructose-6-phosphate transaminase (isomerizing) [Patescibacteria group bacterium]